MLVHAFPKADVPVVQLSIDARKGFAYHFELGARLAGLRKRGVLIIGSGNVVHNLRRARLVAAGAGVRLGLRFNDAARAVMTGNPSEVLGLEGHRDFARRFPPRITSSRCSTWPAWPARRARRPRC